MKIHEKEFSLEIRENDSTLIEVYLRHLHTIIRIDIYRIWNDYITEFKKYLTIC